MTAHIQSESSVQRTTNLVFRAFDEEFLAIDAAGEYCYSLNETAKRAWELVSTPMPVTAVCAQLCQEFTVDPSTCQQDILELFEAWRSAGLLRVADAA